MPTPKILFVDDEERVVRLLQMSFRSTYEVFTAHSGEEALKIMASHKINVIVSDQRMPEMTGIELLAETRKLSPTTVRILLTGYSDLVAIIGAVNEGEVFRFLNKPWDSEELKKVVAEAVELSLKEEALAASPAAASNTTVPATTDGPPLAKAAALLALDGIASDRHEVMEMFTSDYTVVGASTIEEAMDVVDTQDVGVIVASATVDGEDTVERLAELSRLNPSVAVVVLASTADSEVVVRLINDARIHRFAMRPITPNIFRLAVSAAMKEHHRRLAAQHILTRLEHDDAGRSAETPEEGGRRLMVSIATSLSRFTKIW